jgi:hypothetical protein
VDFTVEIRGRCVLVNPDASGELCIREYRSCAAFQRVKAVDVCECERWKCDNGAGGNA